MSFQKVLDSGSRRDYMTSPVTAWRGNKSTRVNRKQKSYKVDAQRATIACRIHRMVSVVVIFLA